MNNTTRETEIKYSRYFKNQEWLLNVYIIKSSNLEVISEEEILLVMEEKILQLEQTYMSQEFDYFRTGFAFLHYGNRGVDLSIWHIGRWGSTFEVFCCSWYCYGRDITKMEILDSAEPVFCQYEIGYILKELNICLSILQKINYDEQFRKMYIEKWRKRMQV